MLFIVVKHNVRLRAKVSHFAGLTCFFFLLSSGICVSLSYTCSGRTFLFFKCMMCF